MMPAAYELPEEDPRAAVHHCPRCHAVTFGAPCDCARAEVQTAHEVQRLFEPVPTMRGQTTMEGLA